MNLQFADLNNDGHKDIITAVYDGTAMVVYGTEKGWKAPEYMVDANGRYIVLASYYDRQEGESCVVDSSPEGREMPENELCVSTTAYDWDNDGDLDLLVGSKKGHLYLQKNQGNVANPSFEGVNHLLEAGDDDFIIPGGLTAVRPFDWDRDGDDDFLCGSFDGGLYLVENTGKTGAIELAAPVQLLGSEFHMNGNTYQSKYWYADPVDYDNDGKTDLLVGMHVHEEVELQLTKEEEVELERTQKRINLLNKELGKRLAESMKLQREGRVAAVNKLHADEDFKKAQENVRTLRQRVEELQPTPRYLPSVWLFRGK